MPHADFKGSTRRRSDGRYEIVVMLPDETQWVIPGDFASEQEATPHLVASVEMVAEEFKRLNPQNIKGSAKYFWNGVLVSDPPELTKTRRPPWLRKKNALP